MSRFGKPAMLGLTIAAVGTAGLWQSAQASTSTDSSGSAEDESRNIRPGDEQPASPASAIAEETDTSVAAQTIHRDEPYLYTVQERDEVRNIARAHGIHTMTVVWNNDLPDPDLIHPGQQLLILPVDGVLVEVQPGDTLRDLATYFGVNMTAIINYEPNGIIDPDVILPGQQLIIPGGAPPSPPSTGVSSVQSGDTEAQSGPASQAGETTVPASAQYDWDGEVVVEPGDTLGNIAHRFGVTASELAQANQIDDVDLIVPGAVLQVPDGETAPVETSQTQQDPPPAPVPEPDPDPVPAPDPEPDPPPPDPVPEPEPEADPPPQPQPDPTPTPVPDPPPQPEPTPTQQPAPDPTPTPQPDPDPEPASPSGDVPELLEYWAIQYDLDPNLLKAVAWVESGWNQNAVSVSGAQGVMQIMPGTGTWINNNLVSDNLNIAGSANDNIRAGAAYLRHMIDITGSVERGLAAYLQGPHTVQASGITESAQRYIDNVMRIRDHFAAHGTPP